MNWIFYTHKHTLSILSSNNKFLCMCLILHKYTHTQILQYWTNTFAIFRQHHHHIILLFGCCWWWLGLIRYISQYITLVSIHSQTCTDKHKHQIKLSLSLSLSQYIQFVIYIYKYNIYLVSYFVDIKLFDWVLLL